MDEKKVTHQLNCQLKMNENDSHRLSSSSLSSFIPHHHNGQVGMSIVLYGCWDIFFFVQDNDDNNVKENGKKTKLSYHEIWKWSWYLMWEDEEMMKIDDSRWWWCWYLANWNDSWEIMIMMTNEFRIIQNLWGNWKIDKNEQEEIKKTKLSSLLFISSSI